MSMALSNKLEAAVVDIPIYDLDHRVHISRLRTGLLLATYTTNAEALTYITISGL